MTEQTTTLPLLIKTTLSIHSISFYTKDTFQNNEQQQHHHRIVKPTIYNYIESIALELSNDLTYQYFRIPANLIDAKYLELILSSIHSRSLPIQAETTIPYTKDNSNLDISSTRNTLTLRSNPELIQEHILKPLYEHLDKYQFAHLYLKDTPYNS